MKNVKLFFWTLSGLCLIFSLVAYFSNMPAMSWGGLGFIGGVLFILGLGDAQP